MLGFSWSLSGQENDSLQILPIERPKKVFKWHTYPSVRWNTSAMLNVIVPAASLVFEYPLSHRWGVELEGGPLLSGPSFRSLTDRDRFSGFRFRGGPKLYLHKEEDKDPFYLRITFKYDQGESTVYRAAMDPSQSFEEIIPVLDKFESIGGIFYGGFMTTGLKGRMVFDFSIGLGYNQWKEERSFKADRIFPVEPNSVTRNLGSALPIFSLGLQMGYRFGTPVPDVLPDQ